MSKLSSDDYRCIENNLMDSIASLKQIREHVLEAEDASELFDYGLQTSETIEMLEDALKRFWKLPQPDEGN
jgi:hypothetical protein